MIPSTGRFSRAEATCAVIICPRERAGDGSHGHGRPPDAGPLALGGHCRVRAGRDHHLGMGPAAAGHQGGPRRRHGHDRAAPGRGDRRSHPRAARVDPGPALAGKPPGCRGSAPSRRRRDDRHGARAHPELGSAGRGRLRDHRGGDRHPRRADQRRGRRRRAGRGAHPHADDARGLVHRGRCRGGDRRGLRGSRHHSLGAAHRRGRPHRGGRPRDGAGNPARGARTSRGPARPAAGPASEAPPVAPRLAGLAAAAHRCRHARRGTRRGLGEQLAHPGGTEQSRTDRRGRRAVLHRVRRLRGAHPDLRRPRRRPPRTRPHHPPYHRPRRRRHCAVHPGREPLDRPARRGAVGGRRLHGLPSRHVRGGGKRTRPGRPDQRRRLHRLLRQPRRTTRHRRARPVRRTSERPVAHRGPVPRRFRRRRLGPSHRPRSAGTSFRRG